MPNKPLNARLRAAQKPWDHKKTAAERGYGREYRRLRVKLLKAEPLCRPCGVKGRTTAATMTDHIVGLARGGAAHDLENLQPICRACHDEKSAREKGHRVRFRISPSGWPEE
jgi:5-methylcytosine-specific restriction protein A